jgi:putative SbcD/Mre11-related phosphoesterase
MDHSRYEVAPGIWLDARRALWLAESRTLAIADLHLGYAWAHRHTGQLMPITVPADTRERLLALQDTYKPAHVVLLGDIVHRAVPIAPVRDELQGLLTCLPAAAKLTLVAGNHDRHLDRLLDGQPVHLSGHASVGDCVFLHGDADSTAATEKIVETARAAGQWIIIGHEHPALTLGDGVATWEKCPCFLICDGLIVLPAFSRWAAGNSREEYMSPLLACTEPKLKVAILGDRLIPVTNP